VPAERPVTTPPVTVATAVVPLFQTPPEVAFVSVTVLPTHTVGLVGKIAPGAVFTVTTLVTKQLPIAYVIVAVPTAMPVTIPPVVTETIVGALLLQVPPGVASESVALPPRQSVTTVGAIAAGAGLIVTIRVEVQEPIE